jgi:hypothetical protein
MPIVLATREVAIRGLWFQVNLGKKNCETQSQQTKARCDGRKPKRVGMRFRLA